MTTPSDLTTLELVIELSLAQAWIRQTQCTLTGAEAERYMAANTELAERFAKSWIATGEPPIRKCPQCGVEGGHSGYCPAWIEATKHHLTFDFPTPEPTARDL